MTGKQRDLTCSTLAIDGRQFHGYSHAHPHHHEFRLFSTRQRSKRFSCMAPSLQLIPRNTTGSQLHTHTQELVSGVRRRLQIQNSHYSTNPLFHFSTNPLFLQHINSCPARNCSFGWLIFLQITNIYWFFLYKIRENENMKIFFCIVFDCATLATSWLPVELSWLLKWLQKFPVSLENLRTALFSKNKSVYYPHSWQISCISYFFWGKILFYKIVTFY
jgi:hypothetical protein